MNFLGYLSNHWSFKIPENAITGPSVGTRKLIFPHEFSRSLRRRSRPVALILETPERSISLDPPDISMAVKSVFSSITPDSQIVDPSRPQSLIVFDVSF
jgi:hypothetical protein